MQSSSKIKHIRGWGGASQQSIETDPEMTQMITLIDNYIKTIIKLHFVCKRWNNWHDEKQISELKKIS